MKKLLIPILLFMFSCQHIKEGVVVEKWYEEAASGVETGIDPATGRMYTEYWSEPERFMVSLQGTYEGELLTESKSISKNTYNTLHVGDSLTLK